MREVWTCRDIYLAQRGIIIETSCYAGCVCSWSFPEGTGNTKASCGVLAGLEKHQGHEDRKPMGRPLWMHQLDYVGAIRAKISQDTEGVVLCFEQGPEDCVKVIWHFSIPRVVRRSSENSNMG